MGKGYKILVAEDEADIRGLIVFSLQYAGFQVIEASNGMEAVDKALKEVPDLVLLDVRMPRMTGYEACQALKAQEATRQIPVVFLSARGQESEIKQGLESSAGWRARANDGRQWSLSRCGTRNERRPDTR